MRETKPFVVFQPRIIEITTPGPTVLGGVWTEEKKLTNPLRVQVALCIVFCCWKELRFFYVKYLTRRKLQCRVFLLNFWNSEYKLVWWMLLVVFGSDRGLTWNIFINLICTFQVCKFAPDYQNFIVEKFCILILTWQLERLVLFVISDVNNPSNTPAILESKFRRI